MSLFRYSMITAIAGMLGLVGLLAQQFTKPQPVPPGETPLAEVHTITPFLGVIVGENPDKATAGLIVHNCIADGPAAKAGLQNSDVLLRMNDQLLLLHEQLGLLIKRQKVGDQITFTFLRQGNAEPQEAEVTLVAAPSPSELNQRSGMGSEPGASTPSHRITKRTVRIRDNQHAIAITTMQGQPFLTVIRLPSRDVEFQGTVTAESMKRLDEAVQQKVERVAKIEDEKWVFELPPLRPPRQLPPNTGPSGPAPSFDTPKAPPLKLPEKSEP